MSRSCSTRSSGAIAPRSTPPAGRRDVSRTATLVEATIREHGIEAVIHFAALKSVEESFADPGRYFDINVGGTFGSSGRWPGPACDRLVYSSSCAVYGTPDACRSTRPRDPAGERVRRERSCSSSAGCPGSRDARPPRGRPALLQRRRVPPSTGRHGEDWTDAPNLVPVVIKTAAARRPPVRILGSDYPTPDGTAIRDYVHVLDLADAHVWAVEAVADARRVPHRQPRHRGRLVRARGHRCGAADHAVVRSRRRGGATAQGDPSAIWADTSRAEEVLGLAGHARRSTTSCARRGAGTRPTPTATATRPRLMGRSGPDEPRRHRSPWPTSCRGSRS